MEGDHFWAKSGWISDFKSLKIFLDDRFEDIQSLTNTSDTILLLPDCNRAFKVLNHVLSNIKKFGLNTHNHFLWRISLAVTWKRCCRLPSSIEQHIQLTCKMWLGPLRHIRHDKRQYQEKLLLLQICPAQRKPVQLLLLTQRLGQISSHQRRQHHHWFSARRFDRRLDQGHSRGAELLRLVGVQAKWKSFYKYHQYWWPHICLCYDDAYLSATQGL